MTPAQMLQHMQEVHTYAREKLHGTKQLFQAMDGPGWGAMVYEWHVGGPEGGPESGVVLHQSIRTEKGRTKAPAKAPAKVAPKKGALVDVIAALMKSPKPVVYPLKGGLVLTYRPGATFAAGRRDVYPSDKEIEVLVRDAQAAGLSLKAEPARREVPMADGTAVWRIVQWQVETVKL
jgi:hypothetical protein